MLFGVRSGGARLAQPCDQDFGRVQGVVPGEAFGRRRIASGDADGAARLIEDHSRGASENLVARLTHALEPTAKGTRR